MNNELKCRLKQLRKERGLTQKDLANAIDMIDTNYQRYEYGTRTPTIEVLEKLANYYDTSVDYLIGRTNNPQRP